MSYWTKTLSNMIITAENEGSEVTVTSSKGGLKCSFTLKVKVEKDSHLPLAGCYLSRLERLNFKAVVAQNVKSKSS